MRNITILAIVIFVYLGSAAEAQAQKFELHPSNEAPYLPQSLIENYFLGEGIQIQSIQYSGSEDATGFFQGAESLLGIDRGIVLSTGKVSAINQPYSEEASTVTSTDLIQDEELSEIVSNSIVRDISKYEITFIPTADLISFNYVFASEEYPDYVCSQFNDIFGFFISGPNPNGPAFDNTNIAITPNSQNEPVSINTVNGGVIGQNGSEFICQTNGGNLNNAAFYNTNESDAIVFDGILSRFNASINVIPCQTYTMKFAIADIRDELLDSAVFLEAKSFSSNDLSVQAVTANSNGIMIEGCQDGLLQFELSNPMLEDFIVDFKIIGDADQDIDYIIEPSTLVIGAGQSQGNLAFKALEDDFAEGIEEIGIIISKSSCTNDTIWIAIDDAKLTEPDLPELIVQCTPEEIYFDASLNIPLLEPMIFSNSQSQDIFPEREPVYSEIEVSGVYPSSLAASNFAKVCIDELEHPWIEDLDIFLVGPDGQFIELTTDNGEDGGNSVSPDFYRNTCFTLDAEQKIYGENPGGASYNMVPFDGDFLPEGSWNDFIENASYKVNGIWKLMLIDDYATGVGTLKKWSIHFDTNYELSYMWSPEEGLSCTDCPQPIANPQQSTEYELQISDSNGCEIHKSIEVQIGEQLQAPILNCDNGVPGQVVFDWEVDPMVDHYSININGNGWENIDLDSTITINDLSDLGIAEIALMGVGLCSESPIASLSCSSLPCQEIELKILNEPKISCFGSLDGSIKVGSNGNNGPIIFMLEGEENTSGVFTGLGSGTYTIQAIDAMDCVQTIEVIIEDVAALELVAEVNDLACNGEVLGNILTQVIGGTPPYNYVWSNGSNESSLSNLEVGNYTLEIVDQNNCRLVREFVIENNSKIEIEAEVIHPSCDDVFDGSITFDPNILSMGFEATWSDGFEGLNRTGLKSGIYLLDLIHSDGCEYTYTIALISKYNLEAMVAVVNVSCFGFENASIKLDVENGIEPYTVNWIDGQTSLEINDLKAGSYSYLATDAKGCEIKDTIHIETPEALELTYTEQVAPICEGFPESFIELDAKGGTGFYEYKIQENPFSDNQSFNNLSNGTYFFSVKDENSCETNLQIEVSNPWIEGISLSLEADVILNLGETEQIKTEVLNSADLLTYSWTSEEEAALSCYDCADPIFEGLQNQTITATVYDENNCEATANLNFKLKREIDVYVPNVFSPNDDGINDRLIVFGNTQAIEEVSSLSIYDRWGNKVFQREDFDLNDYMGSWDGNYRGKALNPDVFIWDMRLLLIDGSSLQMSGNVSILY